MQHPITKNTFQVTLSRPFDYLSAGEAYRATVRHWAKGTRNAGKVSSVRLDQEDESSGTFLQPYQWEMLQREQGAVVVPHPNRP